MDEKKKVIMYWRTIVMILHELGYDFMYQEEISTIAEVVREKIEADKN